MTVVEVQEILVEIYHLLKMSLITDYSTVQNIIDKLNDEFINFLKKNTNFFCDVRAHTHKYSKHCA